MDMNDIEVVTAYKTSDGNIFPEEGTAKRHQYQLNIKQIFENRKTHITDDEDFFQWIGGLTQYELQILADYVTEYVETIYKKR